MRTPWLVEVRELGGGRSAPIPVRWDQLVTVERYNKVGSWSITAATDVVAPLLVPGRGVVITRGGLFVTSGQMVQPEPKGDGTVSVNGVDDKQWLADRIIYPDPAVEITAQTVEEYTATGPREDLIVDLINLNVGPGALPARRVPRLRVPDSLGRGGTATVTCTLDNLLDKVAEVAEAGGLAVNVVHTEDPDGSAWLDVVISEVADLSATVRFGPVGSAAPGVLGDDWSFRTSAPKANVVVVAGKVAPFVDRLEAALGGEVTSTGDGGPPFEPDELRKYVTGSDSDSVGVWGRRIETLVDQRSTDDDAELAQAVTDALAENAAETEVSATVADQPTLRYREHWRTGDKLGLTFGGLDLADVCREVTTTLSRGDGGVEEQIRPTIGSAEASSLTTPADRDLQAVLRRIAALERAGAVPPRLRLRTS